MMKILLKCVGGLNVKEYKFNDKELYCIARVLQRLEFPADEKAELSNTGPGYCWYCKYFDDCSKELEEKGKKPFYYGVRDKLQKITGVKLFELFSRPREEICLINSFQKECANDYIKRYHKLKTNIGEKAFNKRLEVMKAECPIEYEYLKSLLDREI